MSERINGVAVSYREKSQQCDLCGKVAELRPYGQNGECICFPCAMKDPVTTERQMGVVLFGDPPAAPREHEEGGR
jgi:hypothetical protein